MLRIFEFLYKLRAFLLFVLLEIIAIWMVVRNNSPQGAAFFNSSMAISGSLLKTQSDITGFFSLSEENDELSTQNARLLKELIGQKFHGQCFLRSFGFQFQGFL